MKICPKNQLLLINQKKNSTIENDEVEKFNNDIDNKILYGFLAKKFHPDTAKSNEEREEKTN